MALKLGDLVKGTLKKLSKTTKSFIRNRLVTLGKESAASWTCSLIQRRTGLDRDICEKVATIVVGKIAKEVREAIKKKS